jgi:probable phosphoglycerate mutase
VQKLVGGWYDSELTDFGRIQADAVAERLASILAQRLEVEIFSSDLRRSAQTAEAIAKRLGRDVISMPDLRERSAGVAGGKPIAWLQEREVLPAKDGDRLDHDGGVEGAETSRLFATRVYRAMAKIIERACPVQVIVTHGFVVTHVIAAWIGMPLESTGWAHFKSSPGGISLLQQDDRFFDRAVMYLNDREHLSGLT